MNRKRSTPLERRAPTGFTPWPPKVGAHPFLCEVNDV